MKRKLRRFAAVFFVVLVLCAISVPAIPVHALAGIDDAALLYTIWSAYGMKAGLDITSIGGDSFTRDAMSQLYDEWQNSRVAAGLQQTATALSSFIGTISDVIRVSPGQSSAGTLYTTLRIGASAVQKLAQFYNWLIVDKLGGSSVDATDFTSTSGNIAQVSGLPGQPIPVSSDPSSSGYMAASWANKYYSVQFFVSSDSSPVYTFVVGTGIYAATDVSSSVVAYCQVYNPGNQTIASSASPTLSTYDDASSLYYNYVLGDGRLSDATIYAPVFSSVAAALAYLSEYGGDAGSLTVEPDAGVDVLGIPDVSDLDYVPSDAVIPWSIPYDSALDTTGYLTEAYDQALDDQLVVGVPAGEIAGTGTVGPVGDYVVPDLSDVFPFCLPFDAYAFLSALAADPVAPSFTAELAFPSEIGGTQEVTLDFDTPTFNSLAQILRTMELLLFIVGLIFVTRSMFIRG